MLDPGSSHSLHLLQTPLPLNNHIPKAGYVPSCFRALVKESSPERPSGFLYRLISYLSIKTALASPPPSNPAFNIPGVNFACAYSHGTRQKSACLLLQALVLFWDPASFFFPFWHPIEVLTCCYSVVYNIDVTFFSFQSVSVLGGTQWMNAEWTLSEYLANFYHNKWMDEANKVWQTLLLYLRELCGVDCVTA